VSLKEKLCILKNYTLLLLGPSPFELWCESYLYFIVRPLCFLLFTTKSPSSSPNPSFSLFLLLLHAAAPARSCAPPCYSAPLCAPLHASCCSSSRRPRCPRWLFLTLPRRTDAPSGRHAIPSGTPALPTILSSAHDRSLSLSSLRQCTAIKPDRTPFLAALPLPLPRDHQTPSRRRTLLTGILP
jgi:hypothetical protein